MPLASLNDLCAANSIVRIVTPTVLVSTESPANVRRRELPTPDAESYQVTWTPKTETQFEDLIEFFDDHGYTRTFEYDVPDYTTPGLFVFAEFQDTVSTPGVPHVTATIRLQRGAIP